MHNQEVDFVPWEEYKKSLSRKRLGTGLVIRNEKRQLNKIRVNNDELEDYCFSDIKILIN